MTRNATLLSVCLIAGFSSAAMPQVIDRVSVDSAGVEGNGASILPASEWTVSDDGRYIVFESDADNLVSDDSNGWTDVFVRDRDQGTTTRVSVDLAGGDANGPSLSPSVSADGRYVAFRSAASDLIDGDGNFEWDVFVRDLQLGQTTRVSVGWAGGGTDENNWGAVISGDGRRVAFCSPATDLVDGDTNGVDDLFVSDLVAKTTTRINVSSTGAQAMGAGSWHPSMSADGRFVAFLCDADNLVPEDTNGFGDVLIRDRVGGITTLVSVDNDGTLGNDWSGNPSITADGRFVVFESVASNFVDDDSNTEMDVFLARGLAVFVDGFESGDSAAWSSTAQ